MPRGVKRVISALATRGSYATNDAAQCQNSVSHVS